VIVNLRSVGTSGLRGRCRKSAREKRENQNYYAQAPHPICNHAKRGAQVERGSV